MEKLKLSLDDNLPGNASVRMIAVVKGHHQAINELDSDVKQAVDTAKEQLSKLQSRIEAIENTWYRRLGRRIRRALPLHFPA